MSSHAKVAAAALLGALLGGAVTQARDRQILYRLTEARRICQLNVSRLHTETSRLREQLTVLSEVPTTHAVIRQVLVRLAGTGPSLADVESALEPLTAALVGLDPNQVSPDVLWGMFNNRILKIGGHLYRVEPRALIVAPVTRVLISLTPAP